MSSMTFGPNVTNSRKRVRDAALTNSSDDMQELPKTKRAKSYSMSPNASDSESASEHEKGLNDPLLPDLRSPEFGGDTNIADTDNSDESDDEHRYAHRYQLPQLGPEPTSLLIADVMRNSRVGKMTKARRAQEVKRQAEKTELAARRKGLSLPSVRTAVSSQGSVNHSNAPSVPSTPNAGAATDNSILDPRILGLYADEDDDQAAAGQGTGSDSEQVHVDPYAQQLKLVDGRLVLDADSLNIPQPVQQEVIHRTEVTGQRAHITSATYSKKNTSERWTSDDVERFYRALQMCGTDFSMIEVLFPTRTRTHIRNKFKKEERDNPVRIENCLKNKIPLDIEEFKACIAAKKQAQAQERPNPT